MPDRLEMLRLAHPAGATAPGDGLDDTPPPSGLPATYWSQAVFRSSRPAPVA